MPDALAAGLTQGAVAAACLHACFLVASTHLRAGRVPLEVWAWLAWCSAQGVLFLVAPGVPATHAGHVLGALAVPGAALAHLASHECGRDARRRGRDFLGRLPFVVVAVLGACSAFAYLAWAAPHAGGVDFFYYVLWARDRVLGDLQGTDALYLYSPGVYVFWGWVWRLVGQDLGANQGVIVALLVVTAGASAAVVWRATRSGAAAILSGFLAFAVLSRLDGLEGVTEPLVLVAVLLGLAAWAGGTGPSSRWRTGALILALAIGIYLKQQGVLILAGWLGVVALETLVSPEARRSSHLATALAAPGLSLVLATLLFLTEGRGLAPLEIAFRMARGYARMGSFSELVREPWRETWWLALLALICAVVLAANKEWARHRAARVFAFCAVGAVATLYQFLFRPYLHYAMLWAGLLATAVGVVFGLVAGRFGRGSCRFRLAAWIATSLLAVTVVVVHSDGSTAWVPFASLKRRHAPARPFTDAARLRELGLLARLVRPGSSLLTLPPQANYVHFFLGTVPRERRGRYSWLPVPGEFEALVRDPGVRRILVCRELADGQAEVFCGPRGCAELVRALPELGFELAARMTFFELYSRCSGSPGLPEGRTEGPPSAQGPSQRQPRAATGVGPGA